MINQLDMNEMSQGMRGAKPSAAASYAHVPAMVAYWDRNLRNRLANQDYLQWFGQSAVPITGMHMADFLGPDLFARCAKHAERALAGEPQSFERTMTLADGTVRIARIEYLPDLQSNGDVSGFAVLLSDQTPSLPTLYGSTDSERRYRTLFENMQPGFALFDIETDSVTGCPVDFIFLAKNEAFCGLTGLTERRHTVLGRPLTAVLPGLKDEPSDWFSILGRVALTGAPTHFEDYSQTIGKWVDVVAYCPVPRQVAVIIEDISDRKQIHSLLQEQHERLRVTLHSIGDGVITTDSVGKVEFLNPVAERMTGWTAAEAEGRLLEEVFHIFDEGTGEPADSPAHRCLVENRVIGPSKHTVLISRDASEYGIEDSAAPIRDANGRVLGVILVFRDVTEQRRLVHEMSFRATHDPLTGLINRTEFEDRLKRSIATADDSRGGSALLYIDLDQFKVINDTCGHVIGDRVLVDVAKLLEQSVRSRDTVARLGGDEFAIILGNCPIEQARRIAQSICDQMDAFRFTHEDQRYRVGTSIGLAPIGQHWTSTASLLQAADAACYAAKENGRNRVHCSTDVPNEASSRRGATHLVPRIEAALENDSFELFCQLIFPLGAEPSGLHCEILLRLRENGNLVLPGVFLPTAERFHLSSRIDKWVVRNSFRWLANHRHQIDHIDMIAINLSGQSIGDREFQRFVTDLLDNSNFDVSKVCFEITETSAISNLADATVFIKSMSERGMRFSLDDFGSGVSSFGYLKTLPVNYLKIDGQFVRNLVDSPIDLATVRCIAEVAQAVGKKTVAEFVEHPDVEIILRGLGIDYIQGYLRHVPMPLDDLLKVSRDFAESNSGRLPSSEPVR